MRRTGIPLLLMTASAVLVLAAYLLGAVLHVSRVEPTSSPDVMLTSMAVSGILLGLGVSLFAVGLWRWWLRE
ncbi:hypothetical protein [Nocardioides marmorisolisilvae]|uniref:hypothetical protein n=1 Tax=Nocardioides marmorisolisilvae TaxID=1542737 RepID=UPI0011CDDE40|nr:hypothetical protein [Nocardioides marmorisolisilvae]